MRVDLDTSVTKKRKNVETEEEPQELKKVK